MPLHTKMNVEREIREIDILKSNHTIRVIPNSDTSLVNVITELDSEKSSYLYTERDGYIPLLPLESVENLEVTTMTHIMKRLLVLRMMDCGLDGDNLRNLFKNLQEGVNLSKKTLEHIEKSLDNPWWKESEYLKFVPMIPYIREFKNLDDSDDSQKLPDSPLFKEMGEARLVIDGREVARDNLDKAPGEKKIRIPLGVTYTRDLAFQRLAFTDDSMGLVNFDEGYQYSSIHPIVGIHKKLIEEA